MALNDRDYEEKRDFIRMTMNSSATLTIRGNDSLEVTCHDLSASGLSLFASKAIAVGTTIDVCIQSPNEQFKSMNVSGKVLRCDELEADKYELGIEIESIV